MNKYLILATFILFMIYSIASLFVEIPKMFNNIFYGVISILAIYFLIFHLNIGQGIKDRFNENRKKMEDKKQMKKIK